MVAPLRSTREQTAVAIALCGVHLSHYLPLYRVEQLPHSAVLLHNVEGLVQHCSPGVQKVEQIPGCSLAAEQVTPRIISRPAPAAAGLPSRALQHFLAVSGSLPISLVGHDIGLRAALGLHPCTAVCVGGTVPALYLVEGKALWRARATVLCVGNALHVIHLTPVTVSYRNDQKQGLRGLALRDVAF